MQDSGYGYPPVEDRSQRLPLLLSALAATNQNVPPEPIDALSMMRDILGSLAAPQSYLGCFAALGRPA
jgi:hypothetical protein